MRSFCCQFLHFEANLCADASGLLQTINPANIYTFLLLSQELKLTRHYFIFIKKYTIQLQVMSMWVYIYQKGLQFQSNDSHLLQLPGGPLLSMAVFGDLNTPTTQRISSVIQLCVS